MYAPQRSVEWLGETRPASDNEDRFETMEQFITARRPKRSALL